MREKIANSKAICTASAQQDAAAGFVRRAETGRERTDCSRRRAPKPAEKPDTPAPAEKADSSAAPAPPSPALPGDNRRLTAKALEAAAGCRKPGEDASFAARPNFSGFAEPHQPRSDNSNTQFAILGLLTAENHDVPMERVAPSSIGGSAMR